MSKTNDEEVKQQISEYFTKQKSKALEDRESFMGKWHHTPESKMTPAKSYFAFGIIVNDRLFQLFTVMENVYDNLILLDSNITAKTLHLEKAIEEITKKVNVDMSSVKTEIDGLKNTVKEPMLSTVYTFLEEMKKKAKEVRKASEEYVG